MRRSLILDTTARAVVPTALVFSLYLLFTGHNAPGGGFVGGLVAGAALVLRWLADGRALSGLRLRPSPLSLLGAGITIAVCVGMGAWAWDLPFLTHGKVELDLPVFHHVKVTSALPFDVGVYLIVLGLVLTLLTTLGAEEPGTEQPVDLDADELDGVAAPAGDEGVER